MMLSPRKRWALYGLAAAGLAALLLWAPPAEQDVVQPVRRATTGAAPQGSTGIAPAGGGLASVKPRGTQAPLSDPFATLGEVVSDAEAATAARAVAALPMAPSAPPLPFSYLGRWQEQGKTFVFLQRDERSYKIDGPGALDGDYAVQSVDERSIAFKYLPLGIVQVLRLDAPPPVPTSALPPGASASPHAATAAAQPGEVPEEGN